MCMHAYFFFVLKNFQHFENNFCFSIHILKERQYIFSLCKFQIILYILLFITIFKAKLCKRNEYVIHYNYNNNNINIIPLIFLYHKKIMIFILFTFICICV